MKILGFILFGIGVLALVYGAIDHTKNRDDQHLGAVASATSENKSFPIPAAVAAAVLVYGGALLVVGATRRSPAL